MHFNFAIEVYMDSLPKAQYLSNRSIAQRPSEIIRFVAKRVLPTQNKNFLFRVIKTRPFQLFTIEQGKNGRARCAHKMRFCGNPELGGEMHVPFRSALKNRFQYPQHGLVSFDRAARTIERGIAGQSAGLAGNMQNNRHKQSEEDLLANDEVSKATFELAAIGMAHIATDGRFLQVNDKLCSIVGYQRDELLRMTFRDITHPDDLAADLNCMRRALSSEIKTYSLKKRYVCKDRSIVWANLNVSLVRSKTGAARHFISVVEDITARQNAEEELAKLRQQLWHTDRVEQIAAVTASLAHELSQPLTAILTNAQVGSRFMATGNPDPKEIREIFADIVEDEKRAAAVVRGLRNLLRNKETTREKINLADAIQRIIEMLHSEFLEKQVQLKLDLEPDAFALADVAQVQQVVLNLVMNALEAMQCQLIGQRRLELTMRRNESGEALVAVCDSGSGIHDDLQQKVFEPFWTSKQEGMGIGLVISRSIIESYKGHLWFSNNPRQGVTFYFTLPLTAEPDPAGPGIGLADSSSQSEVDL